jgi:hypothetical protein
MLGLEELVVLLLGIIHRVTGLRGRLLGLSLLAEGATDVALHGGTVLEKMLRLPPMEWVGGFERLLEVFRVCSAPVGLWSSDTIGHGDHLLPAVLLVLVLLVATLLGRG